jgi:hypothetical protein
MANRPKVCFGSKKAGIKPPQGFIKIKDYIGLPFLDNTMYVLQALPKGRELE